jgi:hypothetical protein
MGLNINIVTKYDLYYNKNYYFLHEDLDYSQMYTFVLNHQGRSKSKLTTFIQRIQYMCI